MKLNKKNMRLKKRQANLDKFSKPGLIFQTHNSWNLRLEINQRAQFPINLMLEH
jgi:hypothetical protein